MLRRTALVSFFALLLILAAALNYTTAKSALEQQSYNALSQQWGAMKGYLRLEYDSTTRQIADHWYFDDEDPDQKLIATSLQEATFIADRNGRVLRAPKLFRDLGIRSPASVQDRIHQAQTASVSSWIDRRSAHGWRYLIREGIVYDELRRSPLYVAVAVPLPPIRGPVLSTLALTIAGVLLGWSLGRPTPRAV